MDNLSRSLQDCLETILELGLNTESVRVTDLANRLGIAKASVNQTIKKLKQLNLVNHESYGPIKLTKTGYKVAKSIKDTHNYIYQFLTTVLAVSSDTAEKDACLMEHVISKETLDKLVIFLDRFEK